MKQGQDGVCRCDRAITAACHWAWGETAALGDQTSLRCRAVMTMDGSPLCRLSAAYSASTRRCPACSESSHIRSPYSRYTLLFVNSADLPDHRYRLFAKPTPQFSADLPATCRRASDPTRPPTQDGCPRLLSSETRGQISCPTQASGGDRRRWLSALPSRRPRGASALPLRWMNLSPRLQEN